MANEENLIPLSQRTESELREMRSKGGKRSGEVRREKKLMREVAEQKLLANLSGVTFQEFSIDRLIEYVRSPEAKPDVILKILEFLRDTSGQKPKDVVENINPPTINIGDVKI